MRTNHAPFLPLAQGAHPGSRGLALLAAVVVCALTGCKPKTNAFVAPPPPGVTVTHPIRKPVTRFLEYTGTMESYQVVELRARVTGFLDQVNFKPGAAVKKGDLLFVIDPRVYEAQVQQAEADFAARNAALHLTELTFKRTEDAAKSAATSPLELDKARADRDQAKAEAALAEAALVTARLNVEFTQVRAPIDGRITKNLVDVGNLVGASGESTVLATVVSTHPLYVSVDASESDVMMVRRERLAVSPNSEPGQTAPGQWRRVDIATADSNGFNVHGHIDYVDPALNPQSGTIRVRARFENENDVLLAGTFVRLRILLDTADSILAPDIALLSDQNGRYALVINDKDAVEVRRIKIGALDGTMRVVVEGLAVTDRVVINGLHLARPGITVKPTLKEIELPKEPVKEPMKESVKAPAKEEAEQPAREAAPPASGDSPAAPAGGPNV
ncbi:MAG: efflux RND transporter periplasmic adaptor subunit [Pyrinomonadaceae bacterium]|nr:efflux RND transporter periplasmic adaptor subunit [Phycisphaerales bacterium]